MKNHSEPKIMPFLAMMAMFVVFAQENNNYIPMYHFKTGVISFSGPISKTG